MQTALGLASPGLAPGGWREACWKGSPVRGSSWGTLEPWLPPLWPLACVDELAATVWHQGDIFFSVSSELPFKNSSVTRRRLQKPRHTCGGGRWLCTCSKSSTSLRNPRDSGRPWGRPCKVRSLAWFILSRCQLQGPCRDRPHQAAAWELPASSASFFRVPDLLSLPLPKTSTGLKLSEFKCYPSMFFAWLLCMRWGYVCVGVFYGAGVGAMSNLMSKISEWQRGTIILIQQRLELKGT